MAQEFDLAKTLDEINAYLYENYPDSSGKPHGTLKEKRQLATPNRLLDIQRSNGA